MDILVYAEVYNRAAIYARDADLSHDADYRSFGGFDGRSGNFSGRVTDFIYRPQLNNGARTPTPHAFANAATDPQYVPQNSLPPEQRLFNFADVSGAVGPADREYLAGSVQYNICDRYLAAFADFKYMRGFWEGALAPHWRRRRSRLTHSPTRLIPLESAASVSACQSKTHSIHSRWRIIFRPAGSIQKFLEVNSVPRLPAHNS
jgi:hypothetical protein